MFNEPKFIEPFKIVKNMIHVFQNLSTQKNGLLQY